MQVSRHMSEKARGISNGNGTGSDHVPDLAEKPDLIIDNGDLPATAREVRDLLAQSGCIFDRGVPVKLVPSPEAGVPKALPLTVHRVVFEAHRLCRPVKASGDEF